MSPALFFYRRITSCIGPFAPSIFRKRAKAGKEDVDRIHERLARNLPPRLPGPLIWLHGASVGESLVLLGLGNRLLEQRPDLMLLYTSQTQTSAKLLSKSLPDRALHQMAPVDTPGAARRFIRHWQPDTCIFAEGEIWPNLIVEADRSGAKLALVNARMTQKSLKGWGRFKGMARNIFYRFDLIVASDQLTAGGLALLLKRAILGAGNLKSALPPPTASQDDVAVLQSSFIGDRRCWLAASTHEGEEALFLEAVSAEPKTAVIIAPRHPERGNEVEALINARGLNCARRSRGDAPTADTHVLLADTIGEMGLWFALCDAVYLGGANAENVGGHNPHEPLRFGLPVVTGPHGFNFQAAMHDLADRNLLEIANAPDALRECLQDARPPDAAALDALQAEADAPMQQTLDYLAPLLPPAETVK